jgi:hypothetical protein
MATVIGETVLGATVIGAVENGAYVIRHGNRVLVREPLMRHAVRFGGGAETERALRQLGRVEVSGAFWNKVKKATKKTVSKTVSAAKKVAKNKVVKELYKAAKSAAPSPYKEYIAGAETGVRFANAMSKKTPKGVAARKALPVVRALAEGKVSLKAAKAKGVALGLKGNTIRDAAASMKLRTSNTPQARAVMAVVADIAKVTENPTRIVQAASGRRYEVLVRQAG